MKESDRLVMGVVVASLENVERGDSEWEVD